MSNLGLEYRVRELLRAGVTLTATAIQRILNSSGVVERTVAEIQTVLDKLVAMGIVLSEKRDVFYPERFTSGVKNVDRKSVSVFYSTEIEQGVDP